MIKLTRLSGEPFVLNAELIRYVESRPDTYIALVNGDRIIVRESMDEVLERALAYQRSKYLIPAPHAFSPQPMSRSVERSEAPVSSGNRSAGGN